MTLWPKAFSVGRPWTLSRKSDPRSPVGLPSSVAAGPVPGVEHCRYDQGERREGQEDQRDHRVQRHHVGEDGHRGHRGHDDLREVLAEEGLQPLDTLRQREHHVPGAIPIEVPWAKLQSVFVDVAAQPDLHGVGGMMVDRILPVLEQPSHRDQAGDYQ